MTVGAVQIVSPVIPIAIVVAVIAVRVTVAPIVVARVTGVGVGYPPETEKSAGEGSR
jgi:hypothetical protein